ncbi:MAG TPA: LacI family DNA-binding transcriptional regulator [Bacilli bacterium]
MAKLKDVAEYVGVSISTVSRVINGDTSRSVNSETRKKIWEAVSELGYQPNKLAKQLVKGSKGKSPSSKKIGCIVAAPQNKYNHPYFSHILEGIEKGLAEEGYFLSYIQSGEDIKDPAILHKVIHENPIDGMILVEGIDPDTYEYIKKYVKHIVGIDISDPNVPRVSYDRIMAAKLAVMHLIEQGHKDIGYIGGFGLAGTINREKRFRGYTEAMRDAGLKINESWVLNADWDVDKSYQMMKQVLAAGSKLPTAMFAASDMMAISAMRAVLEAGLKIPEDIAFIGIDNIDFSQYTSPPLSTIHIPKFEIGHIAAKTLVDYLQDRYPVPVKITVLFQLIKRQSSDYKRN